MQLLLYAKTRKYIEVHVHEPESTWHANVNGDVATTGRGKVRKEGTPPASVTRERERVESIPAPRQCLSALRHERAGSVSLSDSSSLPAWLAGELDNLQ